jgi:hypothetical protein
MRSEHLKLVQTNEEILAAARRAREQAAKTREGLVGPREERAATLAEARKLQRRLEQMRGTGDDPPLTGE